MLGDYQEWLQHNDPKDTPEFLSNLLSSWEVEQHDLVSQQAIIGLAFAELKLTADCHPVIRKGALEALELQAAIVEDRTTEDATIQEWIRRIGQLKSKLQS